MWLAPASPPIDIGCGGLFLSGAPLECCSTGREPKENKRETEAGKKNRMRGKRKLRMERRNENTFYI